MFLFLNWAITSSLEFAVNSPDSISPLLVLPDTQKRCMLYYLPRAAGAALILCSIVINSSGTGDLPIASS